MNHNPKQFCGKKFFKYNMIMLSYQKDMLVAEFASTCLRNFLSLVAFVVNKLDGCIYGHEIWLCFKRHIFESQNSNTERIELFSEETCH